MRGEIRFGVLGPLYAHDGDASRTIAAPKLRAILAALLLKAPYDVSVDELVDAVWPDAPPRNPRAALHTYLNRLRHLLGPALGARLATTTAGYRVEVDARELDTSEFEARRSAGHTAQRADNPAAASAEFRVAIDLWRGAALADVPASRLRDEHATRLSELLPQTWEAYLDAELALGHEASAVGELHRLVRGYPLRERFSEQLMLALYRRDQQGDALTAYQDLQTVLRDELGVEPGRPLRHLYERILAHDPSLRPPDPSLRAHGGARSTETIRPAQLPATAADFTGRVTEVAALRSALTSPALAPAVGSIVGVAGVGKTTLAVHVGHLLRGTYPDGQLYVELRGTSANPPGPDDLLARILRDLGIDASRIPTDPSERSALYRSLLADRRVLLVLDDARDAGQVRPLIPGGRECGVLITSRTMLATLPTTYRCDLDPLGAGEAIALLGRIVGTGRIADEAEAAGDVVAACDLLPLAIRIAAARILAPSTRSVRAFADVLTDATARLDLLEVDDVGVRASFAVSYERLGHSADAARAFRRIGLWTGVDLSVEAIAAMLGVTMTAAVGALDELVAAQLLISRAPGRFTAHDLMRAYAAERALIEDTPADRGEAVRRLLTWYLSRADAAAVVVNPLRAAVRDEPVSDNEHPSRFDDAQEALAWLDAEAANLVSATFLAGEHGLHALAADIPRTMFDWFLRRLDYAGWIATHEVGLASARAVGDDYRESRLLNNLAGAYLRSWRPAEALTALNGAAVLHRRLGDRFAEAVTLSNIVNAYFQLGRMDEALSAGEETIRRYREALRPDSCGPPLITIGEIHRARGELDASLRYASEALDVSRSAGDRTTEGHALANLGHTTLDLGQPAVAVEHYRAAIVVAETDGDRYTSAEAQEGLGDALAALGDVAAARRAWTPAMRIYRDIDDDRADSLAERLSTATGARPVDHAPDEGQEVAATAMNDPVPTSSAP